MINTLNPLPQIFLTKNTQYIYICRKAVSEILQDGGRDGCSTYRMARGSYYDKEYSVIYAGRLPYYLSRRFVSFRLTR